jgi:hypothetical protein
MEHIDAEKKERDRRIDEPETLRVAYEQQHLPLFDPFAQLALVAL